MTKKCEITIAYCNSFCPNFFHKFSDYDHCWCTKLNKRIFESEVFDDMLFDFIPRTIPEECPLEDNI